MKNRKLKNYLKLGTLLFGVFFLLENCENNNEESIHLDFENSENLNLKTVSFQDAKNFFNVKNEEIKEERKLYARKGGKSPLELTPNWNSIDHDELYGIEQAELTLADVEINRSGDYISKLFFINRNDKMESIIFTIFQEEVDNDGKIIEAKMFFNELNGNFIDGYRIENGKITKKIILKKGANIQKASMFMFSQEKEYWTTDCLGGGGSNQIIIYGNPPPPGIRPGPTSHGIGGFTNLNIYSPVSNNNNSSYSGGGASGRNNVTSVAGSLYTYASNEKELAEGEKDNRISDDIVDNTDNDCVKDIIKKLQEKDRFKSLVPDLEGVSHLSQIVLDLFGECKNYDLEIKIEELGRGPNGGLINAKTKGIESITLDEDLVKEATKLSIAKTLIHESMHIFINFQINKRDLKSDFYKSLEDYYNKNSTGNLAQHQFMSQFVEALAYSISAYDNHRQDISYYTKLSWGGLEQSDAYKAFSDDKKKEIQTIIKNERDAKKDAKSTKC